MMGVELGAFFDVDDLVSANVPRQIKNKDQDWNSQWTDDEENQGRPQDDQECTEPIPSRGRSSAEDQQHNGKVDGLEEVDESEHAAHQPWVTEPETCVVAIPK